MNGSVLHNLHIRTRSDGMRWIKCQQAGELVVDDHANRDSKLSVSKKGPPSVAFLAHNRVCVYDCARFGV